MPVHGIFQPQECCRNHVGAPDAGGSQNLRYQISHILQRRHPGRGVCHVALHYIHDLPRSVVIDKKAAFYAFTRIR